MAKAKASDVTNFDTLITEFVTTAKVPDAIRTKLFEEVIAKRAHMPAVPSMLKFAAAAKDPDVAFAAYNAVRRMIREEHAEGVINVIASTAHPKVRQDAESEMTNIIARSQTRKNLAEFLSNASKGSGNPTNRDALNRLLELSKKPQTQ